MMVMMAFFCRMIDLQNFSSLIFSRNHCQTFSPWQISNIWTKDLNLHNTEVRPCWNSIKNLGSFSGLYSLTFSLTLSFSLFEYSSEYLKALSKLPLLIIFLIKCLRLFPSNFRSRDRSSQHSHLSDLKD